MSEMVEKVAKAICDADPLAPEADAPIYIGVKSAKAWEARVPMARAAIEAMREPVMATIKTREALYEAKADKRDPFREDIANQYDLDKHAAEAMRWLESDMSNLIDAALSPKGE